MDMDMAMKTEPGAGSILTDRLERHDRLRRIGRVLGVGMAAAGLLAGCRDDGGARPAKTEAQTAPSTTAQAQFPRPRPGALLPGERHIERQQFGADTFVNYENASGKGPRIPIGMEVAVDCVATGPVEAAPSARGKWYHIIEPPELSGYFVAANTFENGDTSRPLHEQPAVDPNVKPCP